jgi:hypothetical protein
MARGHKRGSTEALQDLADAELAKAASFAGYAASQGDSGGEGFFGDSVLAERSSSPRQQPSRMSLEFGESQPYQ